MRARFAATRSRCVPASAMSRKSRRRASALLYHTASTVTRAWEGNLVDQRRGDARRLLLSRLVVDHHLTAADPFAVSSGAGEQAIADAPFGDAAVPDDGLRGLI